MRDFFLDLCALEEILVGNKQGVSSRSPPASCSSGAYSLGLDKLLGSSARFPYASAIGWQRGHASTHGVLCSHAVLPHHVQEQEAMSTTTPQLHKVQQPVPRFRDEA